MLDKARSSGAAVGLQNVEFRGRLGEELPVEAGCADVVISNGVLNLMPDKDAACRKTQRRTIGALLAGALADALGTNWAIAAIAGLTFASGVIVLYRMYETLPAVRLAVAHDVVTERAVA
jgi:hypothetical protein